MWHGRWIMLGVRNGTTMPPDGAPLSLMPLGLAQPRPAWMRLNHLETSVGCFHLSMHKWAMAPSAICECGMEDQTADHIIQRCQYSPLNGSSMVCRSWMMTPSNGSRPHVPISRLDGFGLKDNFKL